MERQRKNGEKEKESEKVKKENKYMINISIEARHKKL